MASREDFERQFEDFLLIMDDQIDWLLSEATQRGFDLSTEMEDCDKLEVLFDRMSEGMQKDGVQDLSFLFARQLGEVVRRSYGGKWALSWNDDNSINRGLPVVVGHCPVEGVEFAPTRVMYFYALRRDRGLLRRSIEADAHPSTVEIRAVED